MTVGVLSALDAATNELASLISRLDLEATPTTPHGTLRFSPSFTNLLAESPRPKRTYKKGSSMTLPVHPSMTSLISLRPFPQSQNCEVSTQLPPSASSTSVSSAVAASLPQLTTRAERSFVSRPFWPAKSKKASRSATEASMSLSRKRSPTQATACSIPTEPPSTNSRSMSKKKSVGVLADSPNDFTLSRTFRKVMSTLSLSTNKGTELSFDPDVTGVPISKKAQKDLGLAGTLRGSMSSWNPDQSMDLDGPDSDIPNELQVILTGDMLTSLPPALTRRPPSPGLPPVCPLPTPVASHASVVHSSRPLIPVPWMDDVQLEGPEESDSSSLEENDTKRSFDFTTELKRLSESAGSHRHSFMEQLENAFRTPAKYDLEGFGQFGPYEDVPPVPPIPALTSRHRLSDESTDCNAIASSPVSPLLPSPEIEQSKKLTCTMSSSSLSQRSSASSKPSYGELDLNFKFGGSPLSAKPERSQLTLSDIIPPPAHARSLSMSSARENDPTQQSTVSHVMNAPSPSCSFALHRVDSVSSSKCSMHEDSRVDACSSHSRASSQISFKGLESFDEIRRGFEFVENRPAFYPPPSSNQRRNQLPRDSMISIASVSSYGMVINPGVQDPFEYGYESRPASADMSAFVTMSTSVDDTFSFIRRGPRRKRVDSDASSFYFRAPGASRILRPLKSQFHRDSVISTASLAPPVSIYNRSFGVHPGIDSASNICSGAQAYPAYGFAGGNRSSWAPSHRRDRSVDSVMSDISMRIHRPTLGDKMLDSRHDYCLPLTSITASPPESVSSDYLYEHVERRGSFDSIMDDEQSYSRDSIMDQSNRRTSTTSESVFGQGGPSSMNAPLGLFRIDGDRPFSLFSTEGDASGPKREDDTMITVSAYILVTWTSSSCMSHR
jgi:serine/arginine repetitive matrix protein 2